MQINRRKLQWPVTTLIGLLVMEIFARCLVPSSSVWLEYARHSPNNLVRSGWTPLWSGQINIDNVGGQHGSYELRINPFGFRAQSMQTSEKPANTYRIFFMGGSFVEEMALPEEKTFPSLIEKKLKEAYPNQHFECVNAGISGFMSPDLTLQFKHQIVDYHPDLLVVTVPAINDIRFGTLPEYNPRAPLPPTSEKHLSKLWTGSRLIHILYRFAGRYRQANAPYSNSLKKLQIAAKKSPYMIKQQTRAYGVFTSQIQELIQLAKKNNVRILLMSEPSIYQTPLPPEVKNTLWMGLMRKDLNLDPSFLENEMIRFNRGARLIARAESVSFLDLAQSIPKDTKHFYDDVHLSPEGSLKAANEIGAYLITENYFKA